MIPALRLAVADMVGRWSLTLGAVVLVAAPLTGLLLLEGFSHGIAVDFAIETPGDLVVQESNSVGEVTGSRFPAAVEHTLTDMGVAFAIPEIHSVAGSAASNAVLIRGVDLERYPAVTRFELVAGRPLESGDGPDLAMLGVDLADRRGVGVGETTTIRGRPFTVVGVFSVGTFVDNEAWMSLDGARDVLGWDTEDISILIIPAGGPLAEGDVLPGPLSVARRGDFAALADEWMPVFDLADLANLSSAVAAGVIVTVVLWRLAWMRRRELAVLRTLGFGRRVAIGYLGVIGAAIGGAGLATGFAASRVFGAVLHIDAFGLSARAVFAPEGTIRAVAVTGVMTALAVGVAATRAVRTPPAIWLRDD